MKILIALVHHRHGVNTYAAYNEEDLNQKLFDYVTDSIAHDELTHLTHLTSLNPAEAVEAYFSDGIVNGIKDETLDRYSDDLEHPFIQRMASFTTPEDEFADLSQLPNSYETVDELIADLSDDRLNDEYATFMSMVREARALAA